MTVTTQQMLRSAARTATALALFILTAAALPAQQGMRVSGQVLADGQPVAGATIRIVEIGSIRPPPTNAEGRYTFLVPSARVQGQPVTLVVTHRQFPEQRATITLAGVDVVQDFALVRRVDPPRGGDPQPPGGGTTASGAARTPDPLPRGDRRAIDGRDLAEIAGAIDLPSALAGRLPGLLVTHAAMPGQSAPMIYRGPRSLWGTVEPLVVVDGIPLDPIAVASRLQRMGQGGFDHGTALEHLRPQDIAGVEILRGSEAALRYGARAAAGVIAVTTRRHEGFGGWAITASHQVASAELTRRPVFQNKFGQGSNGVFEFFDGRGGGVNDAVEESWGPALLGQAIVQASLTEPGRPDVRLWLPRPDGVASYLESGQSRTTLLGVQRGGSRGGFRVTVHDQSFGGITPRFDLTRRGATVAGTRALTAALTVDVAGQLGYRSAENRPGTGLNDVNPIAGFLRMGRQIDLDTLRKSVLNPDGRQISWIYTGRNNPFFQPDLNENRDDALRASGGLTLTLDRRSGYVATATVGGDFRHEQREVGVVPGWIGNYPFALGQAPLVDGAAESQTIRVAAPYARLLFGLTPRRRGAMTIAADVFTDLHATSVSTETETFARGSGTELTPVASLTATERASLGGLAAGAELRATTGRLSARGGVRQEWATGDGVEGSLFLPSVSASFDLITSPRAGLASLQLLGEWWRAGNQLGRFALTEALAGGPGPGLTDTGLPVAPERTTGMSVGGRGTTASGLLAFDLAYYRERSSNVLLGASADGGAPNVVQSGVIANRGIEAAASVEPTLGPVETLVRVAYSRNRNRVERLAPGDAPTPIDLGPSFFGATLRAQEGYPLGAIVGRRFRRDDAGRLLLRAGLPVAEDTTSVLGGWQPTGSGSLEGQIRYRGFDVGVVFEARRGGKLFSGTNRAGSVAGTLELTAERPDSGLLIDGVDDATGQPNRTHVSAESYFHALGGVEEAWVYDAGFVKLRTLRLGYELPLTRVPMLREHSVRVALIGRNLWLRASVPNVDPETAFAVGVFQGFEIGQIPSVRSLGLQVTILP